ncbi:MAG: gamma-glutamyltransferase, partial [Candidatus Puniceispirillaceae bacterium]
MASTSHPLSTATALDILQKGGNALDAATAAVAVQCVVEPQSTSIGGDCFCLYAPADSNDVIAINGSGRAPAGLDASMLREQGLTSIPQQS